MEKTETSIVAIKKFFDIEAKQFMAEWGALPENDKEDIRKGFADGSMTY